MLAIERAITAFGHDRFRGEHWDKASAYLPGLAQREEIDSVLKQMSEFLDRSDIRYPALRLAKDGAEIPLGQYSRELKIGPHVSQDWIVNERVFSYYNQSATIILQMLQNSLPDFGPVTNRLESYFGANVHASCFITPPNSQGFTAHYDTYSFFAIQLFGSKEWSLYDSTPRLPIRDDRDDDLPWQPVAPAQVLTLREGDILYVPRGLYHSAIASAEAAVHLTIGIFSPNWLDVIRASVSDLSALPHFRQSIDSGVLSSTADAAMSEVGKWIQSELKLSAGIDAMQEQVFARHTDTRQGRLHDLLMMSKQKTNTKYQLQRIPYRKVISDGQVRLQFGNKEVALPAFVDPMLEELCRLETFTPTDLPPILDQESVEFLLSKLLSEGFIRST